MKFMMAKKGIHMTIGEHNAVGNAGLVSDHELCSVYSTPVNGYYVGSWFEGMGMFNVLFPEDSTRELNETEREWFQGKRYRLSDHPSFALDLSNNDSEKSETELVGIVSDVLSKTIKRASND